MMRWRMTDNQFLLVGCCNALLGGKMETVSSVTGNGVPMGLVAAFMSEPPACCAALPIPTATAPLASSGVATTPDAS